MKKGKEIIAPVSTETLAALKSEFPQEDSYQKISLPRLSMVSQDVTEGKGKAMKVVIEAGTFLEEHPGEEVDEETGKNVWKKTELGNTIEGTILYQRKQLRYFDEANEVFTSSPVYDTDDEIIPLFAGGQEVAKGTPKELQAQYPQGVSLAGKPKPKLEVNKVLYVLYEGKPYQLSLRGSSMYAFMDYARKVTPAVPAVITSFSSTPMEKGSISWNQMTFTPVRSLTEEEAEKVLSIVRELKSAITMEKAQYARTAAAPVAYVKVEGESEEDFKQRVALLEKF